jgi:hypothetical protein
MIPLGIIISICLADEAVFVAAGKIEQFQLHARGGGVGHEFGGRSRAIQQKL